MPACGSSIQLIQSRPKALCMITKILHNFIFLNIINRSISKMSGRGYDEFIQEYGIRFQWDIPLMHKYIDWNNLFCDIKTYWDTEAIRHWREKVLKQFIFNLSNVKNPMPLFHAFIQSDIFYLPQIISLVEIPPLACELRCEIWPKWYTRKNLLGHVLYDKIGSANLFFRLKI